MQDMIEYKDFLCSVHSSHEDNTFYGKLEGINDFITFEGKSVDEIQRAFHEAVDDNLELCELTGKEGLKSYKGNFNIRISPELHKRAVRKSRMLGISLNKFIQNSIEMQLREYAE